MPKEKVTLTLDMARLAELRTMVGARSLSSSVDTAIATHLARLKHLTAVDAWLTALEKKHGPIPPETEEWASRVVQQWDTARTRRRRAG